jgi:predicted AAA+ superfamily ATPase
LILLDIYNKLQERLKSPSPLIQVILGPRQVGKTTTVKQVLSQMPAGTYHYASADAVFASDWNWLTQQWQDAQRLGPRGLLVIDEVQKIHNWSELIKKHWDESLTTGPLRVVLLGSSSLALQTGLSESLTGRFELIRAYHWNFLESQKAFGFSLDEHLRYGGYPGAAAFKDDFSRWYQYVKDSIVETVLGKDILQLRQVSRPALFRQVFELLCNFPAREVSYRKLVGQLQDPGSIETIKNYVELFEGSFLIKSLSKYSTNILQKKSSSPKILPLCPALYSFARGESDLSSIERGYAFELSVGMDLMRLSGQLYYWRDGDYEVDFVYKQGKHLFAIEVKSGRKKDSKGLRHFCEKFPDATPLFITIDSYPAFVQDPFGYMKAVKVVKE